MWKLHFGKKKNVCGIQPVVLNTKISNNGTLIDIFATLIDRFHETFVCINCSDFFQYAFKYLYMFI